MLTSATRVSLLMLVASLIIVNIISLVFYPETIFSNTFSVFKDVILMICAFFFGKSTGGENLDNNKKEPQESVDILSK